MNLWIHVRWIILPSFTRHWFTQIIDCRQEFFSRLNRLFGLRNAYEIWFFPLLLGFVCKKNAPCSFTCNGLWACGVVWISHQIVFELIVGCFTDVDNSLVGSNIRHQKCFFWITTFGFLSCMLTDDDLWRKITVAYLALEKARIIIIINTILCFDMWQIFLGLCDEGNWERVHCILREQASTERWKLLINILCERDENKKLASKRIMHIYVSESKNNQIFLKNP